MKSDNFTWEMAQPVNCETEKCIYTIKCNKEICNVIMIRGTKKSLADRLPEHRRYLTSMFKNKQLVFIWMNLMSESLRNADTLWKLLKRLE